MYKITVPTIITNGHFNKEKTLKELKRCGADRVALAIDREIDYKFSSPENLKLLKEMVDYYRENGFEVLVWLGETLGHDNAYSVDAKYTQMKAFDYNGEIKDIGAFCPLDEKFKEDFCRWIRDVAKCGPDLIMLDDDFRLSNRSGVFMGCCCDKHLHQMSEKLGEKIELSQLKELVFDNGKNKYCDAWLDSQKEAMEDFAKALRDALNEVNPKIRLSFCACTGSWGQEGWNAAEMARIMAGDTKPFLRTIGAPYWAALGNNKLGDIIEMERSQLGKLPEGEVFVEGDTYPRPRTACPAAFLECYDMIIRADGRADGILKYMLDYVSDADYETGYVDAMVRNTSTYNMIEELFGGGESIGVRPYIAKNVGEQQGLKDRGGVAAPVLKFISLNSLPSTYEKGYVNVIFGEHARYVSEEELKWGNIIDISAAKILTERGIDVGIKEIIEDGEYTQKGFTDLPQEFFVEEGTYVRLNAGLRPKKVLKKSGARTVTEYVYGQTMRQDGDFEYENSDGIRFRVMTFDAKDAQWNKEWWATYAKRRSMVKSIKWLGETLAVCPEGNYPELYVIAKKKDKLVAAGFWNLFADRIDNMRVRIEQEFKEIRFVNCKGHTEGDTVVLDTVLYPYEFAGFEIML